MKEQKNNQNQKEEEKRANKLTIFSEPEVIDSIINSRLKQFPAKGAHQNSRKVGWSDDELQLIDSVIWDYTKK